MFLLIPESIFQLLLVLFFTFHNVSINTWRRRGLLTMVDDALHSTMFLLIQLLEVARQQVLPTLHSTMFLLIRYPGEPVQRKNGPLHSTMFLLIRNQGSYPGRKLQHFTFHNVSINTCLVNILRLL